MIRFTLLTLALAGAACAADEAALRAAIAKSLPLIGQSSMTAIEERPGCFTCHHTGLPVMTMLAARERGLSVNGEHLRTQLQFAADFLADGRANYLAGKGPGGAALTAGSALWTLKLGGWKAVESGYPHGKDQFISITAACWATTALVLALPVTP